ncbi:MarR family transcriptional regulator [Stackebrandtia soli]|uniref:MarR family transcriptional regulator n=1 Tax=Stackebrandtia soli TaxID=1892856 RepID=UPI0039E8D41B
MAHSLSRDEVIDAILKRQNDIGRRLAHDRSMPLLATTLTMQQLKLLLLLSFHDDQAGAELASHLGVKLGTLTGIVDRLVRRGLVARREDERDRRVRRVALTDAGRQLINELNDAGTSAFRALLNELDTPTLCAFGNIMSTLVDAADRLGWLGPKPAA